MTMSDGPGGMGGPDVINASGIPTDRIRARLLPYVRAIIDSPEQQEGVTFILSQVTSLAGAEQVGEIYCDFEKDAEVCVSEIIMTAINDMHGGNFKSEVAYTVCVEGNPNQRLNFVLKGERGHGVDEANGRRRDYFPNNEGVLAQFMETNLLLTDKALGALEMPVTVLQKLLTDAHEEIRYLKRGMYERDRQVQQLMDGQLKRTMMYEEHQSNLRKNEQYAEGFKAMAPPIVAQLFGPQAAQMAAALLQNGMGNGIPGLPGLSQGPSDEDLLDDLVLRLEKNAPMRDKILEILMQGDQDALQVLGELVRRSGQRREQRAREQAEESEKRQNSAHASGNGNGNGNGQQQNGVTNGYNGPSATGS